MNNYLQGWNEALLLLKYKQDSDHNYSPSYWQGRLDAINLIKKRIWIKNPEVKGGGFFQEREVLPTQPRSQGHLRQALASLEEGRDLLNSIPNTPRDKIRPLRNMETLKAALREIDKESAIRDKAGNIQDKEQVQESTETFGQIKSKWGDLPELSPTHEYEPHPNSITEKLIQEFAETCRFNDYETLRVIDTDVDEDDIERRKEFSFLTEIPIYRDIKGDKNSVELPDNHYTEDKLTIHNHPRQHNDNVTKEEIEKGLFPHGSLGESFSEDDLEISIRHEEQEMRVTALGYDYVMKLPKRTSIKDRLGKGHYGTEQLYLYKGKQYSSEGILSKKGFNQPSLFQSVIAECKKDIYDNLIPRLVEKYGEESIVRETPEGTFYSFDFHHELMTRVSNEFGFEYKKMRNNTPDSKIKEELLRRRGDGSNE